jgi:hypothetical protein
VAYLASKLGFSDRAIAVKLSWSLLRVMVYVYIPESRLELPRRDAGGIVFWFKKATE